MAGGEASMPGGCRQVKVTVSQGKTHTSTSSGGGVSREHPPSGPPPIGITVKSMAGNPLQRNGDHKPVNNGSIAVVVC